MRQSNVATALFAMRGFRRGESVVLTRASEALDVEDGAIGTVVHPRRLHVEEGVGENRVVVAFVGPNGQPLQAIVREAFLRPTRQRREASGRT